MKSGSPILDIISHLLHETMSLFLSLIQRAFLQEHKGFVVSLNNSSFNSFLLGLFVLSTICIYYYLLFGLFVLSLVLLISHYLFKTFFFFFF